MGTTLLAFGRMILVLGLIIAGLLLLAKFAKKRPLGSAGRLGTLPFGQIEVVSRRSLGQHVSLLVVRVAGRTFLVGQSTQQMAMLAELDGEEAGRPHVGVEDDVKQVLAPRMALGSGVRSAGAWDAFIDHLREMTVRH